MRWHSLDGGRRVRRNGRAHAQRDRRTAGRAHDGGASLRLTGGFRAIDSGPCQADLTGAGIIDFNDVPEHLNYCNVGC